MNAAISPSTIASAESIPYTHADEAHRLLTTAPGLLINEMSTILSVDADYFYARRSLITSFFLRHHQSSACPQNP